MTYVVAEPCVNCRYTDCALVCPVEAFHLDDDMPVAVFGNGEPESLVGPVDDGDGRQPVGRRDCQDVRRRDQLRWLAAGGLRTDDRRDRAHAAASLQDHRSRASIDT